MDTLEGQREKLSDILIFAATCAPKINMRADAFLMLEEIYNENPEMLKLLDTLSDLFFDDADFSKTISSKKINPTLKIVSGTMKTVPTR